MNCLYTYISFAPAKFFISLILLSVIIHAHQLVRGIIISNVFCITSFHSFSMCTAHGVDSYKFSMNKIGYTNGTKKRCTAYKRRQVQLLCVCVFFFVHARKQSIISISLISLVGCAHAHTQNREQSHPLLIFALRQYIMCPSVQSVFAFGTRFSQLLVPNK